MTFWTCHIFFILVNILLILSKYRSTSPPYKMKTYFVADCINRRFSYFWYNEISYKIFWFLRIIAHFCCWFCFFCKLSYDLTIERNKTFQHAKLNISFVFITYGLKGCATVILQKLVEFFFIFAIYLIIFVVICQILCN